MARMIPPTIHPDVKSNAEKRIFRLFKDAPYTDDWVVLHSLGLSRHQIKRRGEIDFVILCDRGVIVIEVKGGRISRKSGIWHTQDRYNNLSKLSESPYEQASTAMFALEKDVRSKFPNDHPLRRINMGYGVMLPATSETAFEFGTDGDRDLTYCLEDARRPVTRYIGRVATFFEKKTPSSRRLAPRDLDELTNFLRGDFDLMEPLWSKVMETEEELLELTREQYQLLDAMIGRSRVIIRGAAGTGKTELARREVLTAARSGKRVLFICFNRLLATKLKADPLLVEHAEKLGVYRVYQYMDELIRTSQYADEFCAIRSETNSQELYGKFYPEYASLVLLENEEDPWDVIVVDEGQDLVTQQILDFLDLCLLGGLESGNWRWFMDDNNQAAVFSVADLTSVSRLERFGISHLLTINCRNTRQIHDETRMLTNPEVHAVARVNGLPVRYAWYSSPSDQRKLLEKQLKRIIDGGVNPVDVVILSAFSSTKAVSGQLSEEEVQVLDDAFLTGDDTSGRIRYSTIPAFKGLEAEVVILTDINDFKTEWWKSVLYVGMSRARVELVILLPENLKADYNQKLRKMLINIEDED
ncbi:MAG: NERD domain-containing protein [Candidatus Thiodiazotropha taylori]|nr:NERD domain-containing protein [Candidatus Thiodiazotropha taylori]